VTVVEKGNERKGMREREREKENEREDEKQKEKATRLKIVFSLNLTAIIFKTLVAVKLEPLELLGDGSFKCLPVNLFPLDHDLRALDPEAPQSVLVLSPADGPPPGWIEHREHCANVLGGEESWRLGLGQLGEEEGVHVGGLREKTLRGEVLEQLEYFLRS